MREEWFYSSGGEQYGPITEEELKEKLVSRELPFNTPVRLGETGQWRAADDFDAFLGLKYLPPPLPHQRQPHLRVEGEDVQRSPRPDTERSVIPKFLSDDYTPPASEDVAVGRATRPWNRFWARSLDYNFYFLTTVCITAAIAIGFSGNATLGVLAGLMVVGVIMGGWVLIEALLLSTFGTTPGKWLLKIKVTNADGRKLSFKQALFRVCHLWLVGLGLGIPLVTLTTQIIAYRQLTSTGATHWDKSGRYIVSNDGAGLLRTSIAILLALFLSLIMTMFMTYAQMRGSTL